MKKWRQIGTDESVRDIIWTYEGSMFAMQVGLYLHACNRWEEPTTRTADGGSATQYIVPLGYVGE